MNSNKYQEKIMTRIKQINKEKMYSRFAFVNSLRGDRGRFFPYIPVAGQLAYQLFDIVQDDGWKIKKNIVNRYQAGKKILNNIYVNLNNLDLLNSLPCVDCLARGRTISWLEHSLSHQGCWKTSRVGSYWSGHLQARQKNDLSVTNPLADDNVDQSKPGSQSKAEQAKPPYKPLWKICVTNHEIKNRCRSLVF